MDERRQASRFERQIDLKIESEDSQSVLARTCNISRNGIYCSLPENIQPFSKLTVEMELDGADGLKRRVKCDGVVVRTDPDETGNEAGDYNVAIYFSNLSPQVSGAIDYYLQFES